MEEEVESTADFDDNLLIKAYDDSIKMPREELARRIALATNKERQQSENTCSSSLNELGEDQPATVAFKVGDYVRATYDVDGVDYEGKIIRINEAKETCVLKYIGYGNQQEVPLCDLLPSWGKKERRQQFVQAKGTEESEEGVPNSGKKGNATTKKNKNPTYLNIPAPPMPPFLSTTLQGSNGEQLEPLSAMMTSWYMSGYYTGIYQGLAMARKNSKIKK